MFNNISTRIKQKIKKKLQFVADDLIIKKTAPYTFCSVDKLKNLIKLCNYINSQKIPGDIVECGTYKGGSAAVISTHLGKDRNLWLYDSFEGMPETSNKDGESAKKYVGEGVASEDDVYEVLRLVGANLEQVNIKKGFFCDSFVEKKPEKIALLHCDADWYESVILVLRTFYDLIPDGGVIILDDFGYWEGCREAFYEFCKEREIQPLIERVSIDQLFWYKGKTTNR